MSAFTGRGKKSAWDTWLTFADVTTTLTHLSAKPEGVDLHMSLIERYQNIDSEACIRGMLTTGQSLSVQQAAKSLMAGMKLTSAEQNEVVRHIADNVVKPQRTSMNAVAEAIVNRYSQLKDDIDGIQLGHGYNSLRNQLENRVAYISRPLSAKRNSMHSKQDDDQENYPPLKKKIRDGYGCLEFLPTDIPDGETNESLDEKKRLLKSLFAGKTWNIHQITELMATTKSVQRQDLVGVLPLRVVDMKAEWPFLLECQ